MRAHVSLDEVLDCLDPMDWPLPPCADASYAETVSTLETFANHRIIQINPTRIEQFVFLFQGRTKTLSKFISLIGA